MGSISGRRTTRRTSTELSMAGRAMLCSLSLNSYTEETIAYFRNCYGIMIQLQNTVKAQWSVWLDTVNGIGNR
jgi:hypothetical protein